MSVGIRPARAPRIKARRFLHYVPCSLAASRCLTAAVTAPLERPGTRDPTTPRNLVRPIIKESTMTTNKPTFVAYAVKNRGKNQSAIWTRIGAAFKHQSGNGFNIELEALPTDGRLVLIEPKAEDVSTEG